MKKLSKIVHTIFSLRGRTLKAVILFLLIPIVALGLIQVLSKKQAVPTVRAFGDLTVTYLGVPLGAPIFDIHNFLPGDSANRNIDVHNGGTVARFVAIKGKRTGPSGQTDPQLETILDIVISEGVKKLYGQGSPTGPKTLQNFFDDSATPDGVLLSQLNAGSSTIYNIKVTFPQSAGNVFQNKTVIFDITFGTVTANHIVINEVFYDVDAAHGIDSWKDRGSPKNDKKKGNDDEWIELYNPTSKDVDIKNWTLEDDSGKKIILHANKAIKANGFVLIAKDASLWKFWNEDPNAVKFQSTDFLGDGLGDLGDHLILKDSGGVEIDFVRWEGDIFSTGHWGTGINPSANEGHSIERIVPGFDTDSPTDWKEQNPPTPGN